jgi:steroid delta-isomerase
MPADAETIRATVDRYTAAFTAGDGDGYVGLFTEDAWIEDPVGTPRAEGHDGIRRFFDENRAMAEVITLVRTGPVRVAAGECAFPMQARPVLGDTTFVVHIIDVMTFDDTGRITTMRAFWDPAEMAPVAD